MRTQRTRSLLRVLALGLVVGAVLLTSPVPAQACLGGGVDYVDCMAYWADVYFECLDLFCAGLSGSQWEECRRDCWRMFQDGARNDCSNCPF